MNKSRTRLALAATLTSGVLLGSWAGVPAGWAEPETARPGPSTQSGPERALERSAAHREHLAEALAPLVKDGTLTQKQADKVAETLAAQHGPGKMSPGKMGPGHMGPGKMGPGKMRSGERGSGPGRDDEGRTGGPGRMGGGHAAVAEALELSPEALHQKMREGQSLAQIAKDQGVSEAELIEALMQSATKRLKAAVADGKLTQTQADQRAEELRAQITERIRNPQPKPRRDGPAKPPSAEPT